MVLEHVDALDLRELLDQRPIAAQVVLPGPSARLDLQVALFRDIADAVAACHAAGVIHKDLSPGNVMVPLRGGSWEPILVDFGLASAEDDDTTQTIGTPGYIAPEKLRGGRRSKSADVYALGVMLAVFVAGIAPETGRLSQGNGHRESSSRGSTHKACRTSASNARRRPRGSPERGRGAGRARRLPRRGFVAGSGEDCRDVFPRGSWCRRAREPPPRPSGPSARRRRAETTISQCSRCSTFALQQATDRIGFFPLLIEHWMRALQSGVLSAAEGAPRSYGLARALRATDGSRQR